MNQKINAPKETPATVEICRYPTLSKDFNAVVLPIDKPAGWTSFGVIKKLRGMLRVRKIGHAGTLDPMATGVLICLVGKATKQMERFMHMRKTYEGTIRLGEQTPSYDAETEVTHSTPADHLTIEEIETACTSYVGDIEQIPPMYSAVKVKGERLYKKARRGEIIERKARPVTIYNFDVLGREGNDVHFRVACSKGTYIRSLAHDVGAQLGVGGHLVALRRTAIGDISVDDTWSLETLSQTVAANQEDVP